MFDRIVTRASLNPQGCMSDIQESSLRGKRFLPLLSICVFAICNFVAPLLLELASAGPSFALAPLGGILLGSMAGQCCLLAIWGVFGPFRAPVRLVATLTIGVFLMASFALGVGIVRPPGGTLDEIVAAFLFLPLILLAFQLPLWGLKLVTGGRIIHVGGRPRQSTTPRRQFGLRDVMGGTVVIAVALSLASSGLRTSADQGAEDWIALLAACLCCTVVSTFATLPCLWAGMIAKNKQTATGIIAIYPLAMGLLLVVILGLPLPFGTMPWEVPVMFFASHATLMAVILGTLDIARLCGYTFISRRRPQPNLQTDCPFAVQGESCESTQAAETSAGDAGKPLEPDRPSV